MNKERLTALQSERGTKVSTTSTMSRTLEAVEKDCRKFIEKNSDKYRNVDAVRKKKILKGLIIEYVNTTAPMVDGYITAENTTDTVKLIERLIEQITDYGKLTWAMEYEGCYEIQCNGKEIKAEIDGRIVDLEDKNHNRVVFQSVEEQQIILKKLLGDTRLTPKDQVVSARTFEGYRICAVHYTATSPDPSNPTEDRYSIFVLRKFKDDKMRLADIVVKRTMSDGMARLLSNFMKAMITFITCGPTGSGKSTTNNAIMLCAYDETRVILVQNPSEIDLRKKDMMGFVRNNVVHLESVESDNPSPTTGTAQNLMDAILRLSPDYAGFGEIRTNNEFVNATKLALAGHPFSTTYHAHDAIGAFYRYVQAYMSGCPGLPVNMIIRMLCGFIDFIIVQKKYPDKVRRISQIAEVAGFDEDKQSPIINDIYRYEITGEPVFENGKVKALTGCHRRVGKISDKTITKFRENALLKKSYEFLTVDPSKEEIETYTGKNIEDFGLTQ